MTFLQELSSWNPFAQNHVVNPVPTLGQKVPDTSKIRFPRSDNKSTIVLFLRHCGCPFAEKSFKSLRATADSDPSIHFIAVSHSDQNATSNWLQGIGGAGAVEVVLDDHREVYGAYGLGLSSFWHTLNPWSMASALRLGRSEQIWNRPTESGSRWQTAGLFGINDKGVLTYVHIAQAADDLGNVQDALKAVEN